MVKTPGERLKFLRKKYKITQQELSSKEVSRSMIAALEAKNNINNITEKTAKVLSENFNRILMRRGEKVIITFEEIRKTTEEQVKEITEKIIQELSGAKEIESIIKKTEELSQHLDNNSQLKIYKIFGDELYNREEHTRALTYYLRVVNSALILGAFHILGEITVSITRIFLNTERYSGVVDLEKFIRPAIEKMNQREKEIVCFNFGVLFDGVKMHKEALKYFGMVHIFYQKDKFNPKTFDIENYIALNYIDLGEYEKADKIFNSLQRRFKGVRELFSIYSNKMYMKDIQGDFTSSEYYHRKVLQLYYSDEIQSEDRAYALEEAEFFIGKRSSEMNRMKHSKEFLLRLITEDKTKFNIVKKCKAIEISLGFFNKQDLATAKMFEKKYLNALYEEIPCICSNATNLAFSKYYAVNSLEDLFMFHEEIKKRVAKTGYYKI